MRERVTSGTNRQNAVRAELAARGADGLITDSITDIFYVAGSLDATGFLVVPQVGMPWLLTSTHDGPQATDEARETTVGVWQPGEDPVAHLVRQLAALGGRQWLVTRLAAPVLERLRSELPAMTFELAPGLTHALRRVKEPAELAVIRQAARIVEAGMAAARDTLRPGVSEIEVAAAAERAMRQLGQDGRVFETKVESGRHAAQPSRYAGDKAIESGDLVLIDIGPTYRGYFGDLTRTFSIGEPVPATRRILELVLAAQTAAISAVRAGRTGQEVDAAARNLFAAAGVGDRFLHHTGHTLGLVGDSDPIVAPGRTEPLIAGECITIEPGIYLNDIGGARIEDEVLVTVHGGELITDFPKRLEDLILPDKR